jgi:hypothetical protein
LVKGGRNVSLDQEISEMLEQALENLPHWKTGALEFVESLRDQYEEKGQLSEKQIEALEKIFNELGER